MTFLEVSGNAVIEALSRELPVMCLDLGGPRQIVTPQSGVVISTAGRNTAAVVTIYAGGSIDGVVGTYFANCRPRWLAILSSNTECGRCYQYDQTPEPGSLASRETRAPNTRRSSLDRQLAKPKSIDTLQDREW